MSDNLKQVLFDIDDSVRVGDSFLVGEAEECKKLITEPNKRLNIITQNIRSIDCNFQDFLIFVTRLNIKQDIIILTECWLKHLANIPTIPNFRHFATQVHINQNSGVVVYVRDGLDVSVTEPKMNDADCLVVKIGTSHAVVCLYRSPSVDNIERFQSSLNDIIADLRSFPELYLLGDINIDIKNMNVDPRSDDYLNHLAMHGLLPGHILPTHGPNCLDHCFSKITDRNTKTIVCQNSVTDHSCIILSTVFKPAQQTKPQNIISRVDYSKAISDLQTINWEQLLNSDDPNVITNIFITTVSSIIEKHTTYHVVPKRKVNLKPWITPGLIRCMRWRDKLHLKHKKNPSDIVLLRTYKRYRNFCTNLLHSLKRSYERSELNKYHGDIKRTWKIIKQICNISNKPASAMELLKLKSSPKESADHINYHFVGVGPKLANKTLIMLGKTEADLASDVRSSKNTPFSLTLLPTDEYEIRKIILSLKSTPSTGRDGISAIFLKQALNQISKPIAYLSNLCLSSGVFPNLLKEAIVIPVYKSGDGGSVDNYRPISLLPTLAKILEKVINTRLLNYLESHSLLSPNQFGFRHSKSTTDAIETLVSHVVQKLDNKKKCLGIFLDLAKAFDTVSIPILIHKLECLGVRGVPLQLLTDYLSKRSQVTRVGGVLSGGLGISYGVPQGSVLGPTLFLVYINELCNKTLPNAKIITFADDTVVLFHGSTWDEVKMLAETGFSQILQWLNSNILTLNYSKTKYVTFTIRNNTQPINDLSIRAHTCNDTLSPTCDCLVLSSTKSVKYLGVIVDRNLRWNEHIDMLSKRTRKLMCIFKKIRHINDQRTVLSTYFALCQSVVSYGIVSWGGADKTLLLKTERAQRAVIKVSLFKHYRYPTHKLYKEANVLTIRQLFLKLLILRQHTLPRLDVSSSRVKHKVYPVPFCKTRYAQGFSAFLSPYLYNKINQQVTLSDCNRFHCKRTLDSYLKQLDYSCTEDLLEILS